MNTYSLPNTENINKNITVKIGDEELHPVTTLVSSCPFNTPWPGHQRPIEGQTEPADFLPFTIDNNETVKVEITFNKPFETAEIHPVSYSVEFEQKNNTISFDVSKSGQYNIQLDGLHRNLYLFVDTPIKENKSATYYFKKGVHNVGAIELKSGDSVYFEDGAVVYGGFYSINSENIKITGHGILDGSFEERTSSEGIIYNTTYYKDEYRLNLLDCPKRIKEIMDKMHLLKNGLKFMNCKNIVVEGVILRNCSTFNIAPCGCDNLVFDNIKLIGMYKYNTDGIDLINCSNVTVKNSFFRNFDDCMVIKGCYGWESKICENITVENCVVWCDWGANLEIGAETRSDEIKNIVFKNCDLLFGNYYMRIQNRGSAYVHDIIYENIRIEMPMEATVPYVIQESKLQKYEHERDYFEAEMFVTCFTNLLPDIYQFEINPGKISDVVCKNITVYADDGVKPIIFLEGGDGKIPEYKDGEIPLTGGRADNIFFENVVINGKKTDYSSDVIFKTNEYCTYELK